MIRKKLVGSALLRLNSVSAVQSVSVVAEQHWEVSGPIFTQKLFGLFLFFVAC